MILYINTCERDKIELALISKQDVFLLNKNIGNKQSENLLELLNKFLKSKKIKLDKLGKIIVNTGPGSFTSVRIGVVLANTLSFSLKIPVVGISNRVLSTNKDFFEISNLEPESEFVKPYYYKDANITNSKH